MATSEVEISNRALGRIGISQLIEDLDDPNDRARQCRLQYGPCRDEVLEDFPFNFAQTFVQLSVVAEVEIPGFDYVYRYPAGCMKVHRVTDETGGRLQRTTIWSREVFNYDLLIPTKIPFQVMADPVTDGAKIIVTDLPDAYAWFTRKVTDPSQFSALFRSALAWRMAMELALSLRVDPRLYQTAQNQYIWAVSQAQALAMNEARPDKQPESPAVQVRL